MVVRRVVELHAEHAHTPRVAGQVLLYLGADVGTRRDLGHTMRAQVAIWSCKRALQELSRSLCEAEWAWQTHAYVIWPDTARELLRG